MDRLVPTHDPLPYDDRRIDATLLDVLHRGLDAAQKLRKAEEADQLDELDTSNMSNPDAVEKELEKRDAKRKAQRAARELLRDQKFNGFAEKFRSKLRVFTPHTPLPDIPFER